MQLNAHFVIDSQQAIVIAVPEKAKKFTYFFKEKDRPQRFDEAHTRYVGTTFCLDLYREPLIHTLEDLYHMLCNTLNGKTQLSRHLTPGQVGKDLAKPYDDDTETHITQNYLIWGHCIPISTLLYCFNNKIYLEIAHMYPWRYSEVKDHEKFIYYSYETYCKHYQPYVFQEISHKTVISWRYKAWQILQSLEQY